MDALVTVMKIVVHGCMDTNVPVMFWVCAFVQCIYGMGIPLTGVSCIRIPLTPLAEKLNLLLSFIIDLQTTSTLSAILIDLQTPTTTTLSPFPRTM